MRSYRLVLVLKSELTKEKKKALLDTVEKMSGIKTTKVNELGEKKLMYSIKHAKKADFVFLDLEGEKVTTDLEKRLLINEDILRHLMVRVK